MPRRDDDIERELRDHLDLEAEDQQDRGLNPRDARYAAQRALGNTALIHEDTRAIWLSTTLERFLQDTRYALRAMRRNPAFTAVVVLSLALGVGLNTSVFTVLNALLLRPLPVPEPGQLVRIYQHDYGNASYPNYRDLQSAATTLDSLAAYSWVMPIALGIEDSRLAVHTEQALATTVSANYFRTLGVAPRLGRDFLPEEDAVAGNAPVAIIGDQLWRTRFRADPAVLGRAVRINGYPFSVIGVAPANVPQPEGLFAHELWIPVSMCDEAGIGNRLKNRRNSWLRLIGRLKPGATIEGLRAEAAVIANQVEAAEPKDARGLKFSPYYETDARLRGIPGVRRFGWILQGIVALVLVIACANIVNLQMARSLSRAREIGIRLAIGAGRTRLLRQFITENLLIAFLGGSLGLIASIWGAKLLVFFAPSNQAEFTIDTSADWKVVILALAGSAAIGVLLGLVTTMAAARSNQSAMMKMSAALSSRSHAWFSPRDLLVGAQVALSVVLLASAGLFILSLHNAQQIDLGLQPQNRLTVAVNPGMQRYDNNQVVAFHAEALRRAKTLPGVISAASTFILPLSGGYLGDGFVWPHGDSQPSEAGRPMVFFDRISPDYFKAIGATLLSGREFTGHDRQGSPLVAVVNDTFARTFWPNGNAIGKRFHTQGPEGPSHEIIGVIRDGKYNSLGEKPQPHVYQPFLQDRLDAFVLVLHAAGPPEVLASAIRAELRKIDPAVPVTAVKTMEEHLGYAYWGARFGAGLLSFFAVLGLTLSAIGLYGVLAFVVSRSLPEIGIRGALGATPNLILRLFLRRGMVISLCGALGGVIAAFAASRALTSYLYGVSPSNPWVLTAVAVVMLSVSFIASYLPSRRAAQIEPLSALRHE